MPHTTAMGSARGSIKLLTPKPFVPSSCSAVRDISGTEMQKAIARLSAAETVQATKIMRKLPWRLRSMAKKGPIAVARVTPSMK